VIYFSALFNEGGVKRRGGGPLHRTPRLWQLQPRGFLVARTKRSMHHSNSHSRTWDRL